MVTLSFMKRSFLFIILIFFPLSIVFSEIKVDLQLSDSTLILGDEVTVQLKIDGTQDGVTLQFPKVSGLVFRQLGRPSSSSQTVIINGNSTYFSGLIYTIGISARKKGNYQIPGFNVIQNSQTYSSAPFKIRVIDSQTQSNMKLSVEASRQVIFIQQPLDITLKWYLQDSIEDYNFRFPLLARKDKLQLQLVQPQGNGPTSNLNVNGFTIPFEKAEQSLNGKSYSVYSVTFRVFPDEPGYFKIPVASVKAMVKRGSQLQRDFFGRLIRAPKLEKIFTLSKELSVDIRRLPIVNRPKSFTGGVGSFQIQLLSKTEKAKVGDPIEITVKIIGDGKLETVEQPILNENTEYQQNFVIVDNLQPGDIQEDTITFKQVIRARNEQVSRIPPIEFSFFNPMTETYQTISSNSLPLKVLATRKISDDDIIVNRKKDSTNSNHYSKIQRGINANYTFENALESNNQHWTWILFWLVPPLFYLGILIFSIRRQKLQNDTSLVRARSAKNIKNRRLKEAKNLLKGDSAPFFQALSQALSGFIADKLNLGTGELTTVDITKLGTDKLLSTSVVKEISDHLDQFDRLRFTTHQTTVEEKEEFFVAISDLMKKLEKKLK